MMFIIIITITSSIRIIMSMFVVITITTIISITIIIVIISMAWVASSRTLAGLGELDNWGPERMVKSLRRSRGHFVGAELQRM